MNHQGKLSGLFFSSGPARIETDENRSYFLIEIPCREGFEPQSEPQNEPQNEVLLTTRQNEIMRLLNNEPHLSKAKIAERIQVSYMTVKRDINKLVEWGLIRYMGSSKGGHWEITNNPNQTI